MKTIYIVQYNHNEDANTCNWDLVESEQEAKLIDPDYEIASVDDLYDMMAGCGYIYEGLIKVKEGIVKAVSSTLYDGLRYIKINIESNMMPA
ncbi:hypothetical protein [Brevibacillus sp. NRS-1366]|uniref:hypothetical protein n=1 Tax=Brevibacillus sp. NRS-1366 TaxID=3233899 RepID=UPI003D21E693